MNRFISWLENLLIAFLLMVGDVHWTYLGKKKTESEYHKKLITNSRNQDSWKRLFPNKR